MTGRQPPPDPTGGRPVVPTKSALRPLGLGEVRLGGGFWAQRQEINASATLDHARTWMEKLGWAGNFTAGHETEMSPERRGREFSDSEIYKLLEACAWEIGRTGDPEREAHFADLAGAVVATQADDGYLHTAYGRPGQRPRYHDLSFGHELYCAGHLLQAAVARARTVGTDAFVRAARRTADHVCVAFGPDGLPGVCGHPEIEMALVELARLTGEQRYLDQAGLFIRRRGHRTLPQHEFGWTYFVDDLPVREATVLRGHAVRALYLSSGALDVAVETGDDELLQAVQAQFDNTWARRTYLTGGMGSRYMDESFADDFVLPADRAYSETCAGVAAVQLAWRLLLATGETRYADAIERLLFNVVATAIADDGRGFFYANTLHQRVLPEAAPEDTERLGVAFGARAPWFEVSCCLTNLARTFASLSAYLATADNNGVQLHQYADLDLNTRIGGNRKVGLQVRTAYPDDGAVIIRVIETDGAPWEISLRVPEWATGATLSEGGHARPVPTGRLVVRRAFILGEELRLDLPLNPRYTFPDPRIDATRDCVAVERGPLVLCAESIDLPEGDLDALRVDVSEPPVADGNGATMRGAFAETADADWPYGPEATEETTDPVGVRLVPYHRWARRGPSTMRVWLPLADTDLTAPEGDTP